jgi:hypothetical protein
MLKSPNKIGSQYSDKVLSRYSSNSLINADMVAGWFVEYGGL